MPSKGIVIIDSRGVLNATNEYDLKRHIEYAEKSKHLDSNIRFIILTTNSSFNGVNNFGPLEIHTIPGNRRFSAKYLFQTAKYLKSQKFEKLLLIAGDPWEAAANTLFLGSLSQTKYSTQVQIHADVTSSEWGKNGAINRLRRFLLRFSLIRFDSIRVTRPDIMKKLAQNLKIDDGKFIVSNLRINLTDTNPLEHFSNRSRSISFVGRLSSDRGLDNFVALVSKLASLNFKINVVGSGPEEQEFVTSLTNLIGTERVIVWGELKPQEMNRLWDHTGVLVSTAPSESFGRTIREAASLCIPVWGVASTGFVKFREFADVDWIRILDTNLSDTQIRQTFEELVACKTTPSVRKKILEEQEGQLETLILCWLSLLEKAA